MMVKQTQQVPRANSEVRGGVTGDDADPVHDFGDEWFVLDEEQEVDQDC
jgi:hypothetical protein